MSVVSHASEPGWYAEVGPAGAQLLSDASLLVGSTLDEGGLIRDLTALCLRDVADWAVVYLCEDAGVRRVHAAARRPGREDVARAVIEHAPARSPPFVLEVVSGARGRLARDPASVLAEDGTHRALLARLGEADAGLAVPLHARGRVLGVLALASDGVAYGPAHVALAEALGRQMGLALDNARLLSREQKARRDAEAAAQRMARLQRVTAALSEALTPADAARIAVTEVSAAAGAFAACMLIVTPDGAHLENAAAHGTPRGPRTPMTAGLPVVEALRAGHAYYVEDAAAAVARFPDLAEVNRRVRHKSFACLPFHLNGRPVGALVLNYREPRGFSHEDREFLEALGRQVGQAAERARLFESEQRARGEAEAAFEALRGSEARYRLIAEHTLDLISRLSPEGVALYVSPASRRILGFEPEELVGARVESFIHPEDRLPEGTHLSSLLGPNDTYTRTYRRRRKDGGWVWLEMTGHGVRDAQTGELREIVTVSRDITERRRNEQELEAGRRQVSQSEKLSALGSLVSGVAHEIRTPLAYITNHIFLIQQRIERAAAAGDPEMVRLLGEVRVLGAEALDGTDRINTLVKDLSRFIRQAVGPRKPSALHEAVAEAVRLFQATHRGEMTLEADLRAGPLVSLDRVQVQQVVLNLLENAYDASPKAARARVMTRPAQGGVELVIEDDGPGIPPEVQARMFDPFFTTKKEGTGLGLSIVRRIAETHAATLRCESAPGKGTRFTLLFPAADA